MSWGQADTLPRTVPFRQVLWDAATDTGLNPEMEGLDVVMAAQFTRGINLAYRYAWEYYDWPDAAALAPLPVSPHPIHGGLFLPRQTEAGLRLATVSGIWEAHPLANPQARPICYKMGPDGYYLQGYTPADDPALVHVAYRPDCPRFTSIPYVPGRIYGFGDLVYLPSTGHCYRCQAIYLDSLGAPGATPAPPDAEAWAVLPILYILEEAVKAGATAMFHRAEGQHGTAGLLDAAMTNLLDAQILQIDNQNARTKTYRS